MMFRAPWRGGWLAVLLLLAGVSCAPPPPPELTRAMAASLIEGRLAEPVGVTYLNPMKLGHCIDITRYLVYCQSAGLVELEWLSMDPPCGKYATRLTEKGAEFFERLEYTGLPEPVYTTKGWEVALRTPITAELIRVDRIEHQDSNSRKVHYTYRQIYDPALTGCTRHSQPGPQEGSALVHLTGGEWRLE